MSLSKYFLPALILITLAASLTFALWASTEKAGAQVLGPIYVMTSASTTNVLTTQKSIMATSSARFREIVNFSGAAIYCSYNDVPATVNSGFFIAGSTTKQWYGDNLYSGAVRCIAPATAAVAINEAF